MAIYFDTIDLMLFRWLFFFFFSTAFAQTPNIRLGVDVFFSEGHASFLKEKKVGLLTNQTGVDQNMRSTLERLREVTDIAILFSPEHGIKGQHYAFENVAHGNEDGIRVYSLHGATRRPEKEVLKELDVVIYDIQSTGQRAYTYPTTLFYLMETAAHTDTEVIVLDRPNPMNGLVVDGPMLEDKWRSFIGYINVPYCHGMTIGELAQFFNEEYKIGCKLKVIPMKGWERWMTYRDTKLLWIPPSPNIPEPDTPLFSCSTGLLGELGILNIGIGFTLPFKIVGAPWVNAKEFSEKLNAQNLPGVHFSPYCFKPFWGLYKGLDCEGVLIQITDFKKYKPIQTQFFILGILKSLYPEEFLKRLKGTSQKELFCKANGTERVYDILLKEKYPAWKLAQLDQKERERFLEKRKKYLLY